MSKIERIYSYPAWEVECFDEIAGIILSASGKINIALSGGSTPIPIYKRIGAMLESLPTSKTENVRFFLVDERNVSLESPQSNSAMILNTIGRKFVIPFDPTEESHEDYSGKMTKALEGSNIFDLVVLGCGVDGHTASLFPNTPLLEEKSSSFLRNELLSDELRYTMTFPLINKAKRRVVFINDQPEKIKYFSPNSLNEQAFPIHQVLSTPNTKVILHEAV